MSLLPWNFDSLSPLDKRAAVENATGMSWDNYSSLPGEQKTALLLSLKGYSIQDTANDMLGASRSDSFWSGVSGWFSGMGAGLKLALLLGVVAVAYVSLPKLGKVRQATRRAA